ncbi:MAG: cytochrome c oxidase subunit 3 [Bacteroidia bacterium]|jgi:cytochrome c oxidase subunit 3
MNTKKKMKDPEPLVAPGKFNLWLLMLASSMLFASLVSAFIVHKPDAQAKSTWTAFDLPIFFLVSVFVAVLSSVTIFVAWKAAKNDELNTNKTFTALTLALGLLFCVTQYLGWKQLISLDLTLVNARPEDISASYVWMITGVHVLHVLGGLVLLSVALVKSFKLEVHKKNMTLMSITHTYWHFVGLLWIFLYLFLYFAQ